MGKLVLHIIVILFFIAGCSNNKKQENSVNNSMKDMTGMTNQKEKPDTTLKIVVPPANKMVLSNAETIHPVIKNITQTIHASGYIAFDERKTNKVAVRTGGRIEKLYVKLNYQYIHKGDKVLELYSPELNTYQEEYLHHLNTKSDSNLIDATKQKLMLLGLSVKQINEIKSSRQPQKTTTIYSPHNGFVLYDFQQQQNNSSQNASSATSGMNEMSSGANAQQATNAGQMGTSARIREGSYVTKGQTLFELNDCKEVYAIIAFDANEGAAIKANAPVKITSQLLPGNAIKGSVNFIEPAFNEGQKFIQVRVYLKNESLKLKVNSIVNAELELTGKYLVVPSSSILSLGNRKFVWVNKKIIQKRNKVLQAKEIKARMETGNFTQIISGITQQDEIAKDAGYLLDSESLIKPEEK